MINDRSSLWINNNNDLLWGGGGGLEDVQSVEQKLLEGVDGVGGGVDIELTLLKVR